MNYPDSVQFLYALGNEIKTAKLGLDRIERVLDELGRPQDRLRIVHVAGTNGKGSTCAMIESGLRAAGRRTGLFTSPHLAEPTERIQIDGRPISAARFAAAFERVHAAVERVLDMHTTYFETVTAMALLVFAEEGVDGVVLEVGLGGRLDATNVVMPELCVITPIDYDHEQYLGRSLEAIAGEKAGILKRGVPAVFAPQRPEAEAVLRARTVELGIYAEPAAAAQDIEIDARSSRFRACGLHIHCPLAGAHQVQNAATAATALLQLGIAAGAIEGGIASARWPGRLEHLRANPDVVVDGAHNPAGARALAEYVDRFYASRPVRMIFGAMRDKAIDEISGILFPHARQVIVTAPHQARALAPEAIAEIAQHPDLRVAATLEEALAMVADAGPEEAIFVTGSLFLVAEARKLLIPESTAPFRPVL
jgi:dihydrofolate synthase/folylpolyglutamate synthase